jgi:signal transduction histidine kinase
VQRAGASTVQSGIPVLGEIPRGVHFCQFYERRLDLLETVVPYLKAGLEENEACVWVTDSDLTVADATSALRSAVPDFETSVKSGQIEIIDSYDWYTQGSGFDADAVLAKWLAKAESVISDGFEGARFSGTGFWLHQKHEHDSRTFAEYEQRMNQAIKDRRIVCLCSYALHRAHAMDVLDVVSSHEFALSRRSGGWEVVEAAALKAAKEELHRANETLELKVLDRTAEVERLLISEHVSREAAEREAARSALLFAQAQEAIRLRDEFFSIASHELYTPLHSLQLVVQGASSVPGAMSPDVAARAFKLVSRQCKRLVGLVGTLLDASRIAAGSLILTLESVDLVEVVKDMLEELEEELARAGCTLSVSVPDGAVLGQWNRLRLEEVVANLLSNAVKFGSGKPIHVSVEKVDGTVRLRVQDHGIGIPPDRLSKIFERFERAVPSRQYGGLGLGLYIVQAIVGAMGGKVRAESVIGAGATFVVELPCGEPEQT